MSETQSDPAPQTSLNGYIIRFNFVRICKGAIGLSSPGHLVSLAAGAADLRGQGPYLGVACF